MSLDIKQTHNRHPPPMIFGDDVAHMVDKWDVPLMGIAVHRMNLFWLCVRAWTRSGLMGLAVTAATRTVG
eukprot:4332529-Amphidinium_carterae.1